MNVQAQPYLADQQLEDHFRDVKLPLISAVGMFILGAFTGYPVQIVGKLYPGEIILALVAVASVPGLFSMPRTIRSQVLIFLFAMLVGFGGYVLSDIYRESESTDYMRGWAHWGFMILSFLALVRLTYKQPKYLFIFMLGFSLVNGSVPFLLPGSTSSFINTWKFFAAVPIIIGCLYLVRKWRPIPVGIVLVFLGITSAALDTRSIALLCLLTAGLVVLAGKKKKVTDYQVSIRKNALIGAVVVLAGCVWAAIFVVQKYAEVYDLSGRQERSSTRRLAMALTTFDIIRESPFIGYGSWARDRNLAKKQERMMGKLEAVNVRGEHREDIIIAHSQVLQTWLEGGMLGVFFCLVFGIRLGFCIIHLGTKYPYHALVPFYIFLLWHSSWHLMFSPFRGTQRIFIAVTCVIITQVGYDLNLLRSASASREWLQNYWRQAMAPRPSYGQLDAT